MNIDFETMAVLEEESQNNPRVTLREKTVANSRNSLTVTGKVDGKLPRGRIPVRCVGPTRSAPHSTPEFTTPSTPPEKETGGERPYGSKVMQKESFGGEVCGSVGASGVEGGERSGERREGGKRGRRPGRKAQLDKQDMKAKLERSRQSARECRARKKLRYQYLEELVTDRERAVIALRKELDKYCKLYFDLAQGRVPEGMDDVLQELGIVKEEEGQ